MHKATVIAQREVSEGKVTQLSTPPDAVSAPATIGDAPIDDVPAMVRGI